MAGLTRRRLSYDAKRAGLRRKVGAVVKEEKTATDRGRKMIRTKLTEMFGVETPIVMGGMTGYAVARQAGTRVGI